MVHLLFYVDSLPLSRTSSREVAHCPVLQEERALEEAGGKDRAALDGALPSRRAGRGCNFPSVGSGVACPRVTEARDG